MKRRDFNKVLAGLGIASGVPTFASAADSASSSHDWLGAGTLTDVDGLKVGHFTSKERPTGCSVVICEKGAVAGVDVRGSAPGTRETDLLNPLNMVQQVQAIVLSGGSAYGLDTATGVMKYLEEHKLGFKIGDGVVPIVPAAILFDLGVGNSKIRPNAESGYQACLSASNKPVPQGNVGAGAGATVGKMFGPNFSMKAGLGTASVKLGNTGIVVGAMVAVNAVGDVINPKTAKIVAGARDESGNGFRDTSAQMLKGFSVVPRAGANSTIGIVATNATLDKTQATKIAQMAHDGYARAINPVHTIFDGDTIFALATGTVSTKVDHSVIGAIAAEVMAQAIVRAAINAEGLPDLPAYRDLNR